MNPGARAARPRRLPLARLALGLTLFAAAAVGARERPAPHPPDDTEVFTGGEDVVRGGPARHPALAYWKVRATLTLPANEGAVRVALLVPLSDGRQDVLWRRAAAPGLGLREVAENPNLRAEWTGDATPATTITYEIGLRITETEVAVPDTPLVALRPPPEAAALAATPAIQADAPTVVRRARRILADARRLDGIVWSLYQYVAAFQPAGAPPGAQDAASVLAVRRGTSLGRARALVALLRAAGVPARVVGGLRLRAAPEQHATSSWVEAWMGTGWVPLDPTGGHYARLPNDYLALYRGDLPLIVHTRGLGLEYAFAVRPASRQVVEEGEEALGAQAGSRPPVRGPAPGGIETHAAHVREPVASVVLVADQSVPVAIVDRILGEAREAQIDLVLLTARFESRYFRETYLERLMAQHLALIRAAHLVLVATADDAGLFALAALGERGVRLDEARIVAAGAMTRPAARMLGALVYELLRPGEVVVVPRSTDLLPLWEMARANLLDGTPMGEEGPRWNVEPLVLTEAGPRLPAWRRPILRAWARIVRAEVPLGALTLILVLPIIASMVVAARVVVGLETFGMFGPVIVALAFVTTGLWWGTLIFGAIVGLGVALRVLLQRLRLQAIARLAILITLVAAVMAGLTLVGATLGVGPLLNISIFPMIIMSNVIENFAASQLEFGTRQAIRMTLTTLGLAIACYLVVERAGLQALVLACPELLLATLVFDVALGKWRGLRLLEYARFHGVVRRGVTPQTEIPRP